MDFEELAAHINAFLVEHSQRSTDVTKPRIVIEVGTIDDAARLEAQIKTMIRPWTLHDGSPMYNGRLACHGLEFTITSRQERLHELNQRGHELRRWFERFGDNIRV